MLTILTVSLFLTLLLELGFALAWGVRGRRELLVVALVNCLTNPPAVLFYHTAAGLWRWPGPLTAAIAECAAVLVEWRCYRSCSETQRHPFWFALLANLFSYGAGFLINQIF